MKAWTEVDAKAFVRLVLVAELESRAEDADWTLAYELAQEFDMPTPVKDFLPWPDDPTMVYYWPEQVR